MTTVRFTHHVFYLLIWWLITTVDVEHAGAPSALAQGGALQLPGLQYQGFEPSNPDFDEDEEIVGPDALVSSGPSFPDFQS